MTGTKAPAHPEGEKRRPAWLVWVVAGALLAGGLAAALVMLSSTDDSETTEAGGTSDTADAGELDPDVILQLQTLCFESDPPLFYDDEGFCYPVDPSTLSGDELVAARVPPNADAPTEGEDAADADLDASGSDAPAAPTAPSSDSPVAPAAPTTSASSSGTTAAPTTAAPTTAAPTTAAPTTEAPTTTLPPVNIGTSNWSWNLAFPSSINGVPCVPDPDNGDQYPPGCQDAITGNYNVSFKVDNGAVSGSQTVSGLDSKTATFSGSILPSGSASMNVNVGNLGNWTLNGNMTGTCSISGSYFHDLDSTAGSFSLSSC